MKLFKAFPFVLQFVCFAVFSAASVFAAVNVDTTFNGYLGKLGVGRTGFILQPDGKILISGNFKMINGILNPGLVRLNADGTLDTTFNPPTNVGAIGVQSNGKIIIVINGEMRRLNPDGSLDTTFNSPSVNNIFSIYDLKISSDNKIVFSWVKGNGSYYITRLNADGDLDAEASFASFVYRLAIAPDGKIVYVFGSVKRLNQDLTPDNSFTQVNVSNTVYALTVQPDSKILIQGIFGSVNGTISPNLVRANADGTIDVPFVINASTGNNATYALKLLPNGKILSGKTLRNADGTLESSFTASTSLIIWNSDMQGDGKIIVGGELPTDSTSGESLVTRFNADGSRDTSFQAGVGSFGEGSRVIVQPDNKILVTGNFNYSGGAMRRQPLRLNADGSVDTTFNPSTNYSLGDIFPNGKIIAVSNNRVYRLNSDGSQDIIFPDIITGINKIKALPDGRTLIARGNNLYRYNVDGTLDTTFNVPANAAISEVSLQVDGKILIGGSFTQVIFPERSKIARLNADGTLDKSFNSPVGGINGSVLKIVVSVDGKIVIGGTFTGINFNTRNGLARLNTDGSLDLGFIPPASFSLDDLKVQPDGKVLTVIPNVGCRRLNTDGTLDTSFACTIVSGNFDTARIRGVDLQSDGKIIITGNFLRVNGVLAPGIARLSSVSTTMFDYDGDGKADVSVFRPSENRWYVFRSSDGVIAQTAFAISGDQPVPADFDGDGKTDIAIFRSNGDWWSLASSNNAQVTASLGNANDTKLPSDFNGDGRADYIIFRPSNNTWYRLSSSNGMSSNVTFGLAGDKPVRGDFDGDGKSDVAIYRPSTGDWWYQSSINGAQLATRWGIASDIPTPADFDGDGKTDFAVYRPSIGVWYIYNSSNGQASIMAFGLAEDKPIAADYDGDGKSDIAVFRPSTGIWYLMRSTAGFTALQFGISTDIPTPNAFVP